MGEGVAISRHWDGPLTFPHPLPQHQASRKDVPLPFLLFSNGFAPSELPELVTPFHSTAYIGHKGKGQQAGCGCLDWHPVACHQLRPRNLQPGMCWELSAHMVSMDEAGKAGAKS